MKRRKDRLHKTIVVGATPAGIAATSKLGELGIPVTLVDTIDDLDLKLSDEKWRLESGTPFNFAHRPGLIRILRNPNIDCIMPAKITSVKHSSQGFRFRIERQAIYVDPDRCTLCGRCQEVCPATGPDGISAININSRMGLPGRAVIDKRQEPPCQTNCPLGVNAQGYIALAKVGRFQKALSLVRKDNVLPGICGRICTHPCEANCRRGELDEPIAIRDIKRFLADEAILQTGPDAEQPENTDKAPARKESMAVIGSGPSGIAAAADLARLGYTVTVFEKEKHIGGLLRYAIGPHRLPRSILEREIKYIESLGITFVTNHPVDLQKDLKDMKAQYDGVILATGTWKDRPLGMPGEELEGVEGCLSFLNRTYRDSIETLNEKVAVIGDGNAAFDLARTVKRMGADVTLISWFPMDMIPAEAEEVKAANEENITILDSLRVVEFSGINGKFNKLVLKATKPGPPDAAGICWPVTVKGAKVSEMEFDKAFVAIGQMGALAGKDLKTKFRISESGYIQIDDAGETNIKGVYAVGDVTTGPSSVVHAMASGRKVAQRLHASLSGETLKDPTVIRPPATDYPDIPKYIPAMARAPMPERQPNTRMGCFDEVALGLGKTQVLFEAERCLQCGVCSQCLECVEACEGVKAIKHDDASQSLTDHAGVIIIADPDMMPSVKGDDVIRAYGPKAAKTDINAMILRGYDAAAKAMILLGGTSQRPKGHGINFHAPEPGLSSDIRIGVFACRCNDSQGWLDEMTQYLSTLQQQEDIVHVETLNAACIENETTKILRTIREKGITRVVLASCVCCPLNFVCSACTDQRSRLKNALFTATGISRSMVETCNLRGEVLRLIKKDPELAKNSFKGLMDRSVIRVRKLKPLPSLVRNYNFATAVIGDSEAAATSAKTLAEAGLEVFLFGSNDELSKNSETYSTITQFKGSLVKAISGTLGEFQLTVQTDDFEQILQVGSVILGEKSRTRIPYIHQENLPSRTVESSLQTRGTMGIPFFAPGSTSIKGLYLADPPGISISKRKKGAAAAVSTAAIMPRSPRQSKGFTVVVNTDLCRGCGRCVNVCSYQAVTMYQNDIGGWYAHVDEAVCKGCGSCISECPSNAADSPYRNQLFLEQTLEEILAH